MKMIELLYWEGDSWHELPSWAAFFLELGLILGRQSLYGRLVVGLAVPVRAYAASLVATGLVVARQQKGPQDEIQRHFEMLCKLPEHTPLTYLYRGRQLKGFFGGTDCIGGEKRIKVRVESSRGKKAHSRTHLLDAVQALNVDVSERDFERLPIAQRGRVVVDRPEFVEGVLGLQAGTPLDLRSKLEVLLAGQVNSLQQEICDTRFGVCNQQSQEILEGYLQDILCVRRFAGIGRYKSDIHAARVRVENQETPPFVIFAGPRGYLEWRDMWEEAHWIVVLDKTSNQFEDATSLFNQEVYKYGLVDAGLGSIPAIPPGVEVSILREEERK